MRSLIAWGIVTLLCAIAAAQCSDPNAKSSTFLPDPTIFPFALPNCCTGSETFTVTHPDGSVNVITQPFSQTILFLNPRVQANTVFGAQDGKALFVACDNVFVAKNVTSPPLINPNDPQQWRTTVTIGTGSPDGSMGIREDGQNTVINADGGCPTNCSFDNIHYTKTYKYNMSGGGLPSGAYTITFQANRDTLYIDSVGTIHHVAQIQGSASGVWPLFGNDNVRVINQEGNNEVGLWVSGCFSPPCTSTSGVQWVHSRIGPSTDGIMGLGANLTSSSEVLCSTGNPILLTFPCQNQVVGFTYNRPPTLLTDYPLWTDGADSIPLRFRDTADVPLKFWIVDSGGFANPTLLKISFDLAYAWGIWRSENLGFSPVSAGIVDASANPAASHFDNFDCSQRAALQAAIGATPGMINVYYVHQIGPAPPGMTVAGSVCNANIVFDEGSDFAVVSVSAPTSSLVHELGHDLSLQHTGNVAGQLVLNEAFQDSNIMWQGSGDARLYFSEGQTFRANFNSASALNYLYHSLPLSQTGHCPTYATYVPGSTGRVPQAGALESLACPSLDRRVWADGPLRRN